MAPRGRHDDMFQLNIFVYRQTWLEMGMTPPSNQHIGFIEKVARSQMRPTRVRSGYGEINFASRQLLFQKRRIPMANGEVFPPRTDPCSNLTPLAWPGGDGVIDMELLSVIRRWHFRDHFSIREISRRTDLSRNTVRRYLRSDSEETKFNLPDRASKLDPHADKLSHMLRQEAGKSRKQKRTILQLHADLVALGYDGSYNRVPAFAREWKAARQREQRTTGGGVFVPLAFSTGEAFQFDWSEDWAIIA
jgi:hypothetical protein